MIADGNAEWTRAVGMAFDGTTRGMGIRSLRYSMFVDDGVIQAVYVDTPGTYDLTSAATMISYLSGRQGK